MKHLTRLSVAFAAVMAMFISGCETIAPESSGNPPDNQNPPNTDSPPTVPDQFGNPANRSSFWTTYRSGPDGVPLGPISPLAVAGDRLWLRADNGAIYSLMSGRARATTLGNVYAPKEAWPMSVGADDVIWYSDWSNSTRIVEGRGSSGVQNVSSMGGLANRDVVDIISGGGTTWVATNAGAASLTGGMWRKLGTTGWSTGTYLLRDKSGTLWGFTGEILKRYTGTSWEAVTSPSSRRGRVVAAADSRGHIWWSCNGGALHRFDGTKADAISHPGGSINALAADALGNLWIATSTGALRFDGANWKHFTTADGLGSNEVFSVAIDGDGYKWFGLRDAISRYTGK